MQSVKPWLAEAARRPGARLIWASTAGLAVLALATFYVSFRAQFTFMYAVKHQDLPALIEALIADVAMVVCSLLALGMACAGQPAKVARLLVVVFAGLSAGMNYLAADVSSFRSVAVYVMPPAVFAVCTDSDRPEELAQWWAPLVGAEVGPGPDGTMRWLTGATGWPGLTWKFVRVADQRLLANRWQWSVIGDLVDLAARSPSVMADGLLRAHLMRSGGRTAATVRITRRGRLWVLWHALTARR